MAKTKHPVTKTPGVAADLVVDANVGRSSLFLQNFGAVRIFLGMDDEVTPETALAYLDPGGSMSDDTTDDWWSITESGTGDLRGFEVF